MKKIKRNYAGYWHSLKNTVEKEISNNQPVQELIEKEYPQPLPKSFLTEAVTNYYYDIQGQNPMPLWMMLEEHHIEEVVSIQTEWFKQQDWLITFYETNS